MKILTDTQKVGHASLSYHRHAHIAPICKIILVLHFQPFFIFTGIFLFN